MGLGKTLLVVFSLLHALVLATSVGVEHAADDVSTYIIHVAHVHAAPPTHASQCMDQLAIAHYTSFLQGILPSHLSEPTPRLVYAYSHAATGFAAKLAKHQATHIVHHPSILAVFPDKRNELQTTLSPSFLGLSPSNGLNRRSFTADPSLPPPPSTFRGRCISTPSFNATAYCNNKLVGAKYFCRGYEAALGHPIDETQESKSPLDTEGHGTHTASTAAGSAVPGANLFGYANGTAQGMAVRAHIAVYKVCWAKGCYDSDILAGMDEAIADRVNVISLSLGGRSEQLYNEPTSVGAFNAIRRGIFVSAAAGNDGPDMSTANNLAPWMVTVGASSINRRFPANVILGNGETYVGTSLYSGRNTAASLIPLVYSGDAGSRLCEPGKLSRNIVIGKIVLCEIGYAPTQEAAVQQAGGVGAIVPSRNVYGQFFLSSPDLIPASTVTFADANAIYSYTQSAANPVARIEFRGTMISQSPSAPRVAAFSSRGPNRFVAEILKPDIIAPGVDILAAWTGENSPSSLSIDTTLVEKSFVVPVCNPPLVPVVQPGLRIRD
uniref:Peptidase S8/S53 domain-containing protein n=1 Tax=Oryza meridionalis TaxID=40149 RepID=A0A0E0CBD6_9ORYZ